MEQLRCVQQCVGLERVERVGKHWKGTRVLSTPSGQRWKGWKGKPLKGSFPFQPLPLAGYGFEAGGNDMTRLSSRWTAERLGISCGTGREKQAACDVETVHKALGTR